MGIKCTNVILAVAFIQCCAQTSSLNVPEVNLHTELFSNYNPNVVPQDKKSMPVNVTIDMYLMSIDNINEKRQTISIKAFLEITWRDVFLTWDPINYPGVSTISVKNTDIWIPDIALQDTFDKLTEFGQGGGKATVTSDGLSRHTMATHGKQPASVHTISNENGFTVERSNAETRYQGPTARRKRKMYIILGVVILVAIVLAVAIIVPVVVTNNNKKAESSKQKNNCGPFSYPGIDISSLTPKIISARKTCPLKGDCWTGEQCYQCFKRPTWKVGNINNIPVCCANCEISGLAISGSECNCRHNGG